jgi:integrase
MPTNRTAGGASQTPAQPKRKSTQQKPKSRANGDGSIYQRADGMWCGAIKDENGQRKYLYSREREIVSRRLIEAMNNLHRGLPATQKRLTVGAWLDYWLEHIVRRDREPTTYDGYELSVRRHIKPFLGTKILRKLHVEDVERWLRMLERDGRGVRTRQFALTRLRTALRLALKRGHVARNVAELTDMPASNQRKLAPPTTDELRRLLDVIRGDRLEALVILPLATGFRRGELLGLRWEDIDLEERRLTVHARVNRTRQAGLLVRDGAKTQAGQRSMVLPDIAIRALRAQRQRQLDSRILAGARWKGPEYPDGKACGPVFTSTVGTILEPRNVYRYFDRVRDNADLGGHTFHGLRHDFASSLLAGGTPQRIVMEMMGHTNYSMTTRYQHVPDALQREAADRLDEFLQHQVGDAPGPGTGH